MKTIKFKKLNKETQEIIKEKTKTVVSRNGLWNIPYMINNKQVIIEDIPVNIEVVTERTYSQKEVEDLTHDAFVEGQAWLIKTTLCEILAPMYKEEVFKYLKRIL